MTSMEIRAYEQYGIDWYGKLVVQPNNTRRRM